MRFLAQIPTPIPTPETATAWAKFIEQYGALIGAVIIGVFIGMVILLFAQRKGWLSNAQMVESAENIARLETELLDLKQTVDVLLAELKPWRKFQEERLEAFFYANKIKQQSGED